MPSNGVKCNLGDWKDLFIAHVIIIIKSEVSAFPIVFIFFRGCVSEMFVTSYSVTYCIYTFRENREFVFISIVQFMMSANSRICFGLQIVFVCLYITPSHYHRCANFIWRHWTYKMPVRYNLSSVWVRLSIFSQLSIIQYVGLCVFSLPISFMMIERIYLYTLSYYHHQIGSMNYHPLFRVRTWNNGMRCMSFYILLLVNYSLLTHCDLVTSSYGDVDLGQHWFRQWLPAWRHQNITWTNVDFSSKVFCGSHPRAISHKNAYELKSVCVSRLYVWINHHISQWSVSWIHGTLARYLQLRVAHAPGLNAGNLFPATNYKGNR